MTDGFHFGDIAAIEKQLSDHSFVRTGRGYFDGPNPVTGSLPELVVDCKADGQSVGALGDFALHGGIAKNYNPELTIGLGGEL